ncbi:hypothetical protein MKX01_031310 [Papaver californicum]|nr:hypothetical protein MKX01_031310 [Papaver californicum]
MLSSGRSFGGFGSTIREGMKKGDFSMFRTKSTLSKQNSLLPTLRKDQSNAASNGVGCHKTDFHGGLGGGEGSCDDESVNKSVPAGRYFAALRGAELDQVKDSEDILLPKHEQWPFLLRFPIGCFGICLGLSSQAILWKSLATNPATEFLHIPPHINLVIWVFALAILFLISITYALKCIFYFEAVRREYFHPVRTNFFFAPWLVCMFLAIGVPPIFAPQPLHPAIWCTFMTPVFYLELKIYGQWLSGGKRRLCKVANPSTHLSVVGNFVGSILAAKVGWHEPAKFLWAVGLHIIGSCLLLCTRDYQQVKLCLKSYIPCIRCLLQLLLQQALHGLLYTMSSMGYQEHAFSLHCFSTFRWLFGSISSGDLCSQWLGGLILSQ